MNKWWYRLEDQHYWFELTERADFGKNLNLKAPQKDQGGRDYWSYSLLKEMKVNDYVVHYHKKEKSIVAVSQVAKPWISKPTKWTPSKKKQFKKSEEIERPGLLVELKNFKRIKPVSLDQIRKKNGEIDIILKNLVLKYNAAYFPFAPKSEKRPLSVNEGYGFIVTQEFVDLYPQLASSFEKGFEEISYETKEKSADKKIKKGKKRKVSSAKNEAIELYAVDKAEKYLIKEKYLVERMPRKSFPYDLKATKENVELHVEVKGKSDTGEKVIVSRNEVKHAKENITKSVFILVHSIKAKLTSKGYKASGGKMLVLNPWNIADKDLSAYTYEYFVTKK
tara:strand:+ start:73 stop:1080 length:1008 start_codon:yes stop_codon:yes gene_type:complete